MIDYLTESLHEKYPQKHFKLRITEPRTKSLHLSLKKKTQKIFAVSKEGII